MKKDLRSLHTFSVCAYGDSPYLEQCVRSVLSQTVKSTVILCTSTPCESIERIASKYHLMLYVRKGESNIREDWNFAIEKANTPYVTVAHQDDCYHRNYAKELYKAIYEDPDFTMFYTGYRPIKEGKVATDINCLLRAILRFPMNFRILSDKCFFKKATLAFGNSICCPSVTYNLRKTGTPVFTSDMKFNIDWDTFLKFASGWGRFAYNSKVLTYYRIHKDATSKTFIEDNGRVKEDKDMFQKFWPKPVTRWLMKFYVKAYDTYR